MVLVSSDDPRALMYEEARLKPGYRNVMLMSPGGYSLVQIRV
jgi:hypothetical protein